MQIQEEMPFMDLLWHAINNFFFSHCTHLAKTKPKNESINLNKFLFQRAHLSRHPHAAPGHSELCALPRPVCQKVSHSFCWGEKRKSSRKKQLATGYNAWVAIHNISASRRWRWQPGAAAGDGDGAEAGTGRAAWGNEREAEPCARTLLLWARQRIDKCTRIYRQRKGRGCGRDVEAGLCHKLHVYAKQSTSRIRAEWVT